MENEKRSEFTLIDLNLDTGLDSIGSPVKVRSLRESSTVTVIDPDFTMTVDAETKPEPLPWAR